MENKYIYISEFRKLISFTASNRISTNSLDQWLRVETDQEFAVVKIYLLKQAIHNFKIMQKNYDDFKIKWSFHLRDYL